MIKYIIILVFYLSMSIIFLYYKNQNIIRINIPIESLKNELFNLPKVEEIQFNNILPIDENNENEMLNSNKCCLINKEYIEDKNSLLGGKFKYNYTKLENNDCNYKLYDNNNTVQLLMNNINGWNNDYCNKNNNLLGSCRFANKECIDFVTKSYCDNYNMKWTTKTCNEI